MTRGQVVYRKHLIERIRVISRGRCRHESLQTRCVKADTQAE
jgi:hypothetical protein